MKEKGQTPDIILASASPRRRELLKQIGISFDVIPGGWEEKAAPGRPDAVAGALALGKAADVREKTGRRDALIIGADTIVVYGGRIMGKPSDAEDAKRMLGLLAGHEHSVYTGVALLYGEKEKVFATQTRVTMYPMSEEEIGWYVATGEPMDKAGAYGIQGYCARYIEKIDGDYNTVVGLPVGRLYQEIKSLWRD